MPELDARVAKECGGRSIRRMLPATDTPSKDRGTTRRRLSERIVILQARRGQYPCSADPEVTASQIQFHRLRPLGVQVGERDQRSSVLAAGGQAQRLRVALFPTGTVGLAVRRCTGNPAAS